MADLKKLFALSPTEYLVLLTALLFLPLVGLLLKRKGFRRTEKFFAGLRRSERSPPAPLETVQSIARMVSIAAVRGPYAAQCLVQAITLWWILGLMGIVSTVRLGLYKHGDNVEAHAWVLYDDVTVIGEIDALNDYTPLLDVNMERESP